MKTRLPELVILLIAVAAPAAAAGERPDPALDILVTFENRNARATSTGAPYRHRKRYAISADARRLAAEVASAYRLVQIDHWPIRSLQVYCFVYRVPDDVDREVLLLRLQADARVESAQPLNEFETGTVTSTYDDTYAGLQHGLDVLDLTAAHRYSLGSGVRVAIIDSGADTHHEDLRGRIRKVENFADADALPDRMHGTAVTSVIAALTNNAKGIVGVAPEADIELFVACWSRADTAICDSFTLAKAIDALLEDPPDVLNMSLTGPQDPLLERMLLKVYRDGVIMVAAVVDSPAPQFPASMAEVIAVASSGTTSSGVTDSTVYAPGDRILVALPDDSYDFRSGSSLSAAHVSGVVALVKSVMPDAAYPEMQAMLSQSQANPGAAQVSVNACRALQLANPSFACGAKTTGER